MLCPIGLCPFWRSWSNCLPVCCSFALLEASPSDLSQWRSSRESSWCLWCQREDLDPEGTGCFEVGRPPLHSPWGQLVPQEGAFSSCSSDSSFPSSSEISLGYDLMNKILLPWVRLLNENWIRWHYLQRSDYWSTSENQTIVSIQVDTKAL